MRIDTVSPNPTPEPLPTTQPVKNPATGGDTTTTASTDATGFSPTPDLVRLLTTVRETPEVRADVIANITSRLASGEFTSPAAAGDAANHLLNLSSGG